MNGNYVWKLQALIDYMKIKRSHFDFTLARLMRSRMVLMLYYVLNCIIHHKLMDCFR